MTTITKQLQHLHASPLPLAYLQDGGHKSHADFYQDVSIMAQRLGATVNTTWALWLDDSYQFAVNFFALMLAGKGTVLPPNRVAATEAWLAEQHIHYWDGLSTDNTAHILAQPWPDRDWQQAPVVFFTSGSTGTPKQIPRTFGQLAREIEVLQHLFPWPAHSTVMATVSHQHLFGLCYKILLPLQQAAAFVAEQCLYPEDVLRLQQQYQHLPLVLASSPAFLSRWQDPHAASQFLQVFSSGGPLPSDVPRQLQRDIVEIFGSSESGGIAWRHAPQAWQVFPNVRIRADDTQQLWLRTEHAYTTDWLSTGDAISLSEGGDSFELLGRLDRIIKFEEKRLSLDAIEQALQQHPYANDVHVRVLSHGDQQQLAAVCTLNNEGWQHLRQQGKRLFVQLLKNSVRAQLESIALPKRWRFELEIPRNSQSKPNHGAIEALFAPHKRPVSHVVSADDTQAQISLWFPPELQCFQGHFPGLPIYPGVAQLDMVQHHARLLLLPNSVCVGMEQLKFQQPIRPYDQVLLDLEKNDCKVSFTLSRNGSSLATGRLYFQE